MSFDYLANLKPSDMVDVVLDVVRDPSTGKILMNEPHPGTVLRVYHDGADIAMDSPSLGRLLLQWCVHVDDDRCVEIGPIEERVAESRDDGPARTPGTGIFRLSRNQKILVGLENRLNALERTLNQAVLRIAELEANRETRRKPGRPRKNATETSEEPVGSA